MTSRNRRRLNSKTPFRRFQPVPQSNGMTQIYRLVTDSKIPGVLGGAHKRLIRCQRVFFVLFFVYFPLDMFCILFY